ncbi:hypothetical protein ACD661_16160, partial [Legionella lytica]
SIRDTNAAADGESIRDTNAAADGESIRDTNAAADGESIRDTNAAADGESIRDTNAAAEGESIRESSVATGGESIRGTISSHELGTFEDGTPTKADKKESRWGISDDISSSQSLKNKVRKDDKFLLPKKYKQTNKDTNKYACLIGNAKKIVDEIAYICLINSALETHFIEKHLFSKNTGVTVGAIKTTVCRLKDKGVLINYEASKGRHSAWRFTLNKDVFEQYLKCHRGDSLL